MKSNQSLGCRKFRCTPFKNVSFAAMRTSTEFVIKQPLFAMLLFLGMATTSMAASISPAGMSDEFRSRVLNVRPSDLGITKENYHRPVVALIMEAGLRDGSYTLSSLADGSTSLYFSGSSGVVGAGDYGCVREASERLLADAQHFYGKATRAHTFPKPRPGQVIFYFITFDGIWSYTALEEHLDAENDDLSGLFFLATNVISSIRKASEHWR